MFFLFFIYQKEGQWFWDIFETKKTLHFPTQGVYFLDGLNIGTNLLDVISYKVVSD